MNTIVSKEFPEAKGIFICGDIHGDFIQLAYKCCIQYGMTDTHPLHNWFYGHFHQSWHQEIDGVQYNMLDCMELRELRTEREMERYL